MGQNHNYYAIIGNNGYGMSSDWEETISYAKFLQNEWHKGFQTEEDAYNWLVDQCAMRSRLNAYGMCDLATLRSQRLVTIDNVQRPVQETFYRKPAEIKKLDSLQELDRAFDEMAKKKISKAKPSKKDCKKVLMKQFEIWLDSLDNE